MVVKNTVAPVEVVHSVSTCLSGSCRRIRENRYAHRQADDRMQSRSSVGSLTVEAFTSQRTSRRCVLERFLAEIKFAHYRSSLT